MAEAAVAAGEPASSPMPSSAPADGAAAQNEPSSTPPGAPDGHEEDAGAADAANVAPPAPGDPGLPAASPSRAPKRASSVSSLHSVRTGGGKGAEPVVQLLPEGMGLKGALQMIREDAAPRYAGLHEQGTQPGRALSSSHIHPSRLSSTMPSKRTNTANVAWIDRSLDAQAPGGKSLYSARTSLKHPWLPSGKAPARTAATPEWEHAGPATVPGRGSGRLMARPETAGTDNFGPVSASVTRPGSRGPRFGASSAQGSPRRAAPGGMRRMASPTKQLQMVAGSGSPEPGASSHTGEDALDSGHGSATERLRRNLRGRKAAQKAQARPPRPALKGAAAAKDGRRRRGMMNEDSEEDEDAPFGVRGGRQRRSTNAVDDPFGGEKRSAVSHMFDHARLQAINQLTQANKELNWHQEEMVQAWTSRLSDLSQKLEQLKERGRDLQIRMDRALGELEQAMHDERDMQEGMARLEATKADRRKKHEKLDVRLWHEEGYLRPALEHMLGDRSLELRGIRARTARMQEELKRREDVLQDMRRELVGVEHEAENAKAQLHATKDAVREMCAVEQARVQSLEIVNEGLMMIRKAVKKVDGIGEPEPTPGRRSRQVTMTLPAQVAITGGPKLMSVRAATGDTSAQRTPAQRSEAENAAQLSTFEKARRRRRTFGPGEAALMAAGAESPLVSDSGHTSHHSRRKSYGGGLLLPLGDMPTAISLPKPVTKPSLPIAALQGHRRNLSLGGAEPVGFATGYKDAGGGERPELAQSWDKQSRLALSLAAPQTFLEAMSGPGGQQRGEAGKAKAKNAPPSPGGDQVSELVSKAALGMALAATAQAGTGNAAVAKRMIKKGQDSPKKNSFRRGKKPSRAESWRQSVMKNVQSEFDPDTRMKRMLGPDSERLVAVFDDLCKSQKLTSPQEIARYIINAPQKRDILHADLETAQRKISAKEAQLADMRDTLEHERQMAAKAGAKNYPREAQAIQWPLAAARGRYDLFRTRHNRAAKAAFGAMMGLHHLSQLLYPFREVTVPQLRPAPTRQASSRSRMETLDETTASGGGLSRSPSMKQKARSKYDTPQAAWRRGDPWPVLDAAMKAVNRLVAFAAAHPTRNVAGLNERGQVMRSSSLMPKGAFETLEEFAAMAKAAKEGSKGSPEGSVLFARSTRGGGVARSPSMRGRSLARTPSRRPVPMTNLEKRESLGLDDAPPAPEPAPPPALPRDVLRACEDAFGPAWEQQMQAIEDEIKLRARAGARKEAREARGAAPRQSAGDSMRGGGPGVSFGNLPGGGGSSAAAVGAAKSFRRSGLASRAASRRG
ncbi:unnamed protein product [Pedinophyceae sp. YPF-701]|nr:unnamed protein product [Pedinophyceae sp. YPF-701]